MGWIAGAAAVGFALLLLYHSRLELATRLNLGEENRLNTSLYLLGGALRIRATLLLERDDGGHLRIRFLFNGKQRSLKRAKRNQTVKAQKRPVARAQREPRLRISLPQAAGRFAIRHVDLSSLGVSMTIGVADDAAATAKLCGLALTVLESASAVIRSIKPRARVLMRAAARYNADCLRLRLSCIAAIKIGHLIIIAAMIAVNHAKGAFTLWLTRLKMSCAPRWKTSRT